MTTTSENGLRIERLLPAPVEDVFRAWTDPDVMAKWISPVGHAEVKNDLRVGGRFRVVMVGEEMRMEHTGKYLEVDPPTRLVFTWRSPYTGKEPSLVTVSLSPETGHTRLVLVHERLPRASVESHASGWGAMIDRLDSLLVAANEFEKKNQL